MTSADIDSRFEQIKGALQASERVLPQVQTRYGENPIPLPAARYRLTRVVLWAFLIGLLITAGYLIYGGPSDRVAILTDLLKSAMLPLVTLVIGHYFGSSQSDR